MEKTLYLECYSGISGDMTVAALLDLGADRAALDIAINSIKPLVSGFEVEVKRVQKAGIDACDFNVILDEAHENHDIIMTMGMMKSITQDIIMTITGMRIIIHISD